MTTGWLYKVPSIAVQPLMVMFCVEMGKKNPLCFYKHTQSTRFGEPPLLLELTVKVTMLSLNTLSSNQKAQLRNAFTLIDGESRDANITKDDLVKLYATLGIERPTDEELTTMLTIEGGEDRSETGINFAQFLAIMAKELLKFEDRSIIFNALKTFQSTDGEYQSSRDLQIDLQVLKEACCSVQLGEIGSGDHRLPRATFDRLTQGFVQEQMDGKQVFLASKWIDAYVD